MTDFGGFQVDVTNSSKMMYPRDGITKGDIVRYYSMISAFMLPHVRDRPVSMLRFPDGIDGESFFQKQVPRHFPGWFQTAKVKKKGGQVVHAIVQKEADLAYLANYACITPHVWLSRAGSLERPDRMVLDMDPSADDFIMVKDAARAAASELRSLGLEPFVMTTGSRGLHVTIPLDQEAPFEEVLSFAKEVANRMADADDRFTTERLKADRNDRLLVDVFRNAYGQTAVPPYALRARNGAPVATPLDWDELSDPELTSTRFGIHTIFERIRTKGDPWSGIEGHSGSIRDAMARARR